MGASFSTTYSADWTDPNTNQVRHYEGSGVEGFVKSVIDVDEKYLPEGKQKLYYIQATNSSKYLDKIHANVKNALAEMVKNKKSQNEIPSTLVGIIKSEIAKAVTSKSSFGKTKSNGMMMFGNTTSLSQMSGPFGGSRFGSTCGSTAAFGRRNRKNSKKSNKKRKSSFGNGKKGKKGKKGKRSRKVRA